MEELGNPGRSVVAATTVEEVPTGGRPAAALEGLTSSSDASSEKPRFSSRNFATIGVVEDVL